MKGLEIQMRAEGEPIMWRNALKSLGKLLLKPPVILFFALALTSEWWIPAATYLLLKTYLFAPSGVVPWSLVILSMLTFLGGFGLIIFNLARIRPLERERDQLKVEGDMEGFKRAQQSVRERRYGAVWPLWYGMFSFQFVIPAVLAIIFGSSMPVDIVKDHGRWRYETRDEYTRHWLKYMEQRGIFTPMERE